VSLIISRGADMGSSLEFLYMSRFRDSPCPAGQSLLHASLKFDLGEFKRNEIFFHAPLSHHHGLVWSDTHSLHSLILRCPPPPPSSTYAAVMPSFEEQYPTTPAPHMDEGLPPFVSQYVSSVLVTSVRKVALAKSSVSLRSSRLSATANQ
jgi:hypothetical protein